ncbi:Fur family transcriptional regulator [Pendulispora albinea]|uniref:Transcriptional repressor n=1 Tax=Pendulispora albinea TaxID=2741071 RepID=A0ABZ2LP87_9BACT
MSRSIMEATWEPPLTKQKKPRKADERAVQEFQDLLRSSGLRSTAPRVAVLQYLHDSSEPSSHAELFEALASKGFDRATIYRNLMDLAEVGIVSRTDLGDHVWRFELKKGVAGTAHTDEHPHFVCIHCGEVACLPGLAFEVKSVKGVPKSVSKNKVAVQLKGLCDNCG